MTVQNPTHQEIIERLRKDKAFRLRLTEQSFFWFFHYYFAEALKYESAPFQKEIMDDLQNSEKKLYVVNAFRGSAKSTIVTVAFTIWSVITKRKHFATVISQTQDKAVKIHLDNIRAQLEGNKMLIHDWGPFQNRNAKWASDILTLHKFDARIVAASLEKNIRGFNFRGMRPDLIIIDDIEDTNSVYTEDSREKTYRYFTSEILGAGDRQTSTILVGNLFHEDGIIKRIMNNQGESSQVLIRHYPIVDEKGKALWPGKYQTPKSLEEQKALVGTHAFECEYMLKPVSEHERIIPQEWITYYTKEELPSVGIRIAVGIDLAISEDERSDCTAVVSALVLKIKDKLHFYVLPYTINKRMNHVGNLKEVMALLKMLKDLYGIDPEVFVENVQYQSSFTEDLRTEGIRAFNVPTKGMSKYTRLFTQSPFIEQGRVKFAENGNEELIHQLTSFPRVKHDDLVDALMTLIIGTRDRIPEAIPEMAKLAREELNRLKVKNNTPHTLTAEEDCVRLLYG